MSQDTRTAQTLPQYYDWSAGPVAYLCLITIRFSAKENPINVFQMPLTVFKCMLKATVWISLPLGKAIHSLLQPAVSPLAPPEFQAKPLDTKTKKRIMNLNGARKMRALRAGLSHSTFCYKQNWKICPEWSLSSIRHGQRGESRNKTMQAAIPRNHWHQQEPSGSLQSLLMGHRCECLQISPHMDLLAQTVGEVRGLFRDNQSCQPEGCVVL